MATIRAITFDSNEIPATVTLTLTIAEAAALAVLLGKQRADDNPTTTRGQPGELSTIHRCLIGPLFNAHWEDGVDDYYRDDHQ